MSNNMSGEMKFLNDNDLGIGSDRSIINGVTDDGGIAAGTSMRMLDDINDTMEYANYDMAQPGAERVIVPLVFSIVIIFGCLGNIIVIIVVVRNKDHFRNTTNLFILNLSIADLLFLLFCVPFHAIIYTMSNWPFGLFMCKFVHLVQYSSMVASILTLVAMSADRYMAVAHALETKHLRTPTVAFVMSCIIWIIALAIASPFPLVYTEVYYESYGGVWICSDDWGGPEYRQIYYLLLFILGFILPSFSIFILSILLIRQLWMTKQPEGPRMKDSISKKRKVTRLIIVVVLVFCLCWLPSHIIWLWTNFFKSTWEPTYPFYYFRIFAHFLSYGNSAVNPVIYAFLSANFRRGFQRAVLGRNVHPRPVQRFTFTKSSHSGAVHHNNTHHNNNGYMNHHNGYNHDHNNPHFNRYCNINNVIPASSYSDTCV